MRIGRDRMYRIEKGCGMNWTVRKMNEVRFRWRERVTVQIAFILGLPDSQIRYGIGETRFEWNIRTV